MFYTDDQKMDAAKHHYREGVMHSSYGDNWKYDVLEYYEHWNKYNLPSLTSVYIANGVVVTKIKLFACEDDLQRYLHLHPNFKEFKIKQCYVNKNNEIQTN